MDDGFWEVRLHYNGRLSGKTESVGTGAKEPNEIVKELEIAAVRKEGSIFITGWTVQWCEPSPG